MRLFHWVAVCVLCLPLLGCWSEQKTAFAACDTRLPYLGSNPSVTSTAPTRMTRCMADAGYHTDFSSNNCKLAAVPRRSPYCYAPDGFFPGIGHWFESFFLSPPQAPEFGGAAPNS